MKHQHTTLKSLLFTVLGFFLVSPAVAVDDLFDDLGFGGQDDILEVDDAFQLSTDIELSLIHISEPTRRRLESRLAGCA